jgi:hypothetical protein
MRKYIAYKLLFIIAFSFYEASAQPPSKEYQLLYEDNFNGLDIYEADWFFRLDRREGGSFNALNLKQNVFVRDGFLPINVNQSHIYSQQKAITRFRGTLQDIRVFNRGLTKEEILKIFSVK